MNEPAPRPIRTALLPSVALLALACATAPARPPAPYVPGPPSGAVVLVNQVGYLPGLAKIATVRSASATPVDWTLRDAAGKKVASGKTTVFGADAASGDTVHLVDFTAFRKPGAGYRLQVGNDLSAPFAVGADVYARLKYDALALFYHNRSGTPIELPYAGDKKWVRPAGHPWDRKVSCEDDRVCEYELDVAGGWYDAGDHGKYVVNGGITVWTLLDQWERAQLLGRSAGDFADGKMNIPESGNGVPDLLDEVRWELEFMLKMQVPAGQKLAGMVHHKIHDERWTGLGTSPGEDPQPRWLHRPSTAATLNLAATAAQAARIWKELDPAFSARCLQAAETAWAAAKANPALYAPRDDASGGGPYDDDKVEDEFYWAAAELFVTTGKPEYQAFLAASPFFLKIPIVDEKAPHAMNWQSVAALGTISLAVVPSGLTPEQREAARGAVKAAADGFVAGQQLEGYRTPLHATKYPWGSNSVVLDNLVIIALAGDFSHDPRYAGAVAQGMDYLLGRNPMDQSYVTGYGSRPLQHPHHRFFAQQKNPAFPPPPPGIVSGGPNSTLEDPLARTEMIGGCAPEKCWMDHIDAWSVNELAINWNAPLAWVAAWLDEAGKNPPGPAAR
jgi:endoglucanase